MEFTIDRDIFLKSLGYANGIIEKKTTLPILSNILIELRQDLIKEKKGQEFFANLIAKLDLPEAVGPEIKKILDFKSMINPI